MEGWRGGTHTAAFRASGYILIFDPDTTEPILLPAEGETCIGILPATCTEQQQERMVAWLICEIALQRLGRLGYLARVASYGHIAAMVALALLFLDADSDGIPDILAWLMRR